MKYSNFKIKAEDKDYIFASVDCTKRIGIWPFNKFVTGTIIIYLLKKYSVRFRSISSGDEMPYEIIQLWEAEKAKVALNELLGEQK
jgi:hypothetical protein